MTERRRRSEKELDDEVRRLLEEIEQLKAETTEEGTTYKALSEDEIRRKILGETSRSPYMYARSWRHQGTVGQASYIQGWVHNPDQYDYPVLYLSLFFGLSRGTSDLLDGWRGRDTRWPSSSRKFALNKGASTYERLDYAIPYAHLGTYIGNLVLWEPGWVGASNQFHDRDNFYVTII